MPSRKTSCKNWFIPRHKNGKGDPYSYIEIKDASDATRSYLQRTSTYGFDFELMTDPTGISSHVFARILFVLPNSPASEAGLERGNWISAIGKEELTNNNYGYLMKVAIQLSPEKAWFLMRKVIPAGLQQIQSK